MGKIVHVTFDTSTHTELKSLAKADERAVSVVVRRIVVDALDAKKQGGAAA